MIPTFTIAQILALVIVSVATVTDIRSRKIPNLLTFPAALIAIMLHLFQSGINGALLAVGGYFLGCLLMAAPILFLPQPDPEKRKGFGDVKLMGAVGAFLGPKLILLVFFYFCLFYGLLSIYRICSMVPWPKLLLFLFATSKAKPVTAQDMERIRQVRKSYMPLAPAIFAGTVCAIIFEKQTLAIFGFG